MWTGPGARSRVAGQPGEGSRWVSVDIGLPTHAPEPPSSALLGIQTGPGREPGRLCTAATSFAGNRNRQARRPVSPLGLACGEGCPRPSIPPHPTAPERMRGCGERMDGPAIDRHTTLGTDAADTPCVPVGDAIRTHGRSQLRSILNAFQARTQVLKALSAFPWLVRL